MGFQIQVFSLFGGGFDFVIGKCAVILSVDNDGAITVSEVIVVAEDDLMEIS